MKTRPSLVQSICLAVISRVLGRAEAGLLILRLPDGRERRYGAKDGAAAELIVSHWSFFPLLVARGALGLGEAYADGSMRSPNLPALIQWFILNKKQLSGAARRLSRLGAMFDDVYHRAHANTKAGARDNIHAHYDLSNAMFETFLDGSMTYSCAVWEEGDDLDSAQARKRAMIMEKLDLKPGMRMLEIGSGWGRLAIEAARDYGVEVVSITLSEEQLVVAQERAREAGVADKIRFELRDYRDVDGTFDRVVSVEMIEAVGYENLGVYFGAIDRALAHGGKAVIQAITFPNEGFEAYRSRTDFIQKHIFPGSLCPSVNAMKGAMRAGSRLAVTRMESIGINYAKTLGTWRQRFLGSKSELSGLGFDSRFIRLWDFYFSYCEAGFKTRTLDTVQMVLEREEASA
ncbi:MAG: SAM-dependent methyltransferase [Elusimicrobia bacterium]|nr:MAG: SAM-dependent methyltransferase [Elusimicrobiota bacterium]